MFQLEIFLVTFVIKHINMDIIYGDINITNVAKNLDLHVHFVITKVISKITLKLMQSENIQKIIYIQYK